MQAWKLDKITFYKLPNMEKFLEIDASECEVVDNEFVYDFCKKKDIPAIYINREDNRCKSDRYR